VLVLSLRDTVRDTSHPKLEAHLGVSASYRVITSALSPVDIIPLVLVIILFHLCFRAGLIRTLDTTLVEDDPFPLLELVAAGATSTFLRGTKPLFVAPRAAALDPVDVVDSFFARTMPTLTPLGRGADLALVDAVEEALMCKGLEASWRGLAGEVLDFLLGGSGLALGESAS
jgi:hypothetical protein